jgi:DNA modification methylase
VTFAKTANLRTNPNNPRAIRKDQLNKLVKSLQEFPEMLEARPIVIDKDGTVLGGNMRLKAAQLAGLQEVPVYVREWDEDKDGQFIIKDNVSFGEWDQDMLANEWEPEQLDEWGLNIDWDEPEETEGLTDADDVPEVPEEATTKPGDLWVLGEHRLLCGDSTKAEDVARLMNGQKATLIHADPPYGMGKEKDGVLNDNLYREKLDKFQMEWWNAFRKHSHDNASAYIWGNAPDLWRWWYKGGLADSEKIEVRNEICWDKKSIPGMKSDLMHQYPEASERCLYIQIGQQFIGNLNAADFPEVHRPILEYQQQELAKSGLDKKEVQELTGVQMYSHWFTESQFQIIGEKHYRKLQERTDAFTRPWVDLKAEWDSTKKSVRDIIGERHSEMRSFFNNAHDVMRDTWEFSRVHGDERHGHATPKPVDMMERVMKSSCPYGEIVVEPFIGSGPTLIGAEKTGRKCYGMELDPRYCDVVVKRWEAFTGQKAELENEEQEFEILTQAN